MNASLLADKKFTKKVAIIIIIFIFILIVYMGLCIWLFNSSKIFSNIFISGINVNVGGLKPSEARLKADEKLRKQLDKFVIQLVYNDNTWNLNYKDIDLYYLLDNSIKNAYMVGREKNCVYRLKTILSLRKNPRIIKLKPSYNLTKIENKVEVISEIIDKIPINAEIKRENGDFVITKGICGIKTNKEALKQNIIDAVNNFNSVLINIDVKKIEPGVTAKDLENINDIISESVTRFNSQDKERTENIKIASHVINGSILMPGEEFSFNNSTGPRNAEAGYKEASIIVDGEFTTGVGGGVCQVSTTLYQTVLKSDMEVTSRRNHGIPVSYVPMGQDATVAYGYIDFKFINNRKFPIYIESLVRDGEVSVKLYGKKTDNTYINLESEILEIIKPKMQVRKDANMYLSEKRVSKNGREGYKVVIYKVFLQGGQEIKREMVSRDYYPPKDGLIIEGTKQGDFL